MFDVQVVNDEPAHAPSAEQAAAALNPVRYGKKEPQQHTFKADPKSAPRLLTYLFIIPVVAALPALLLVWIKQGANLAHVGHAFRNAPASHAIFLASVFALEAVFFLYYTHWKLFELLPAAGVAGLVAYLSGSRALTEVQERRLAGLR